MIIITSNLGGYFYMLIPYFFNKHALKIHIILFLPQFLSVTNTKLQINIINIQPYYQAI